MTVMMVVWLLMIALGALAFLAIYTVILLQLLHYPWS